MRSMANTYTDNPARGLSKLQKTILRWVGMAYEYYAATYPSFIAPGGVGIPWDLRGTLYDTNAGITFSTGTARGRWGNKTKKKIGAEPVAVSRALKRLEDRGLIERVTYHGRTNGVRLTPVGELAVNSLKREG